MQVALIPPFSLLERIPNTRYHLVLAHLLHHQSYREFYQNVEGYKILDNGAAEGDMVEPGELLTWAEEIGADEVVVPDVLGDYKASVEALFDFKDKAEAHPEFKYVGVAQGKALDEVLACINAIDYTGYCDVLALPRHLLQMHPQQRYYVASVIPELHKGARFSEIHCLGAGSWTREVATLSELPLVRGIDTSMPIVLGFAGIRLSEDTTYKTRSPDYLELEPTDEQMELIDDNIRTFQSWAATPESEVHRMSAEQ